MSSKARKPPSRCHAAFYNLLEPILVALSFSVALEISNLSNLAYVVVDATVMLPFLLTKNATYQRAKKMATWLKIAVAIVAIILKTVATFEYKNPKD
jgi:hypothetical protein